MYAKGGVLADTPSAWKSIDYFLGRAFSGRVRSTTGAGGSRCVTTPVALLTKLLTVDAVHTTPFAEYGRIAKKINHVHIDSPNTFFFNHPQGQHELVSHTLLTKFFDIISPFK
jgi:hypothetical protein